MKQKKILAMALSLGMAVSSAAGAAPAAAKEVKVKKIVLKKPSSGKLSLKKGSSYSLKWKVTPAKGKVKFSSNKKSVATVSAKGKIKAKKKGTATITIASRTKPKKSVKVKVTVYEGKKKTNSAATTVPSAVTASADSSAASTAAASQPPKESQGPKYTRQPQPEIPPVPEKAEPLVTHEPLPANVQTIAQTEDGKFTIASEGKAVDLYVDKEADDVKGLNLVAESFRQDVYDVAKDATAPRLIDEASELGESAVIAGSIGNNDIIDKLIADKKIDVSDIEDKNETFKIQVVKNPTDKVKVGLVIVGSDKRGTIYGIYHISELMGVSPWIFWADVTPVKKDEISFTYDELAFTSKEPSVRYRGIFLNDEAPSLTGWVTNRFKAKGVDNRDKRYNEYFYKHVFELILRCKGNYLWPAMWSDVFSDDGVEDSLANAVLADEYGVIMGTSHHEPLFRAGEEWGRLYKNYGGNRTWDFNTNGEGITEFWDDGVKRNKDFESVITIGMRGEADTALPGGMQPNIDLLKEVIKTQKGILKKYGLENAPQVLTAYKEVEDYWHGDKSAGIEGLKSWDVLDDVIIMLCEDNNGNMRTLPEGDEQINRKGGWGMYYHFDYNGSPVSYMWVNTTQLHKTWEQMTMAYEHGIDDMWIVNVGDLKPMEMNISYFLDMAYDYDTWGKNGANRMDDYIKQWTEQQFVDVDADTRKDIEHLLDEYAWMNNSCKPEVVGASTYNATNYNEARRMLARVEDIMELADKVEKKIPERLKAAYFELVYYPAFASANVQKMQICAGLNKFFSTKKSTVANVYADMTDKAVWYDKVLENQYNWDIPGVGDKWCGMMQSPHIGYTSWNSESWKLPTVKTVNPAATAKMQVCVENNNKVVNDGELTFHDFTNLNDEKYSVFMLNESDKEYEYTATASDDWIKVSETSGKVKEFTPFTVSVDWSKVSADKSGTVTITGTGNTVTLKVNAKVMRTTGLADKTYVYANGYACIMPGGYSSARSNADGASILLMDNYGKMGQSMKVQPALKRYTKDEAEVAKAPYADYKVSVPKAGEYRLTVYSAPSGNLERDDVGIYFGLQVNNGAVEKLSTIKSNFKSGSWEVGTWTSDVKDNGRMLEEKITLTAGVNTIRIYAADPAFVLQKMVVSEDKVKSSFFGPMESYYVGKTKK